MEQLRMAGLTSEEEQLGALIIGNLNRDGYLVMDPEAEPTVPALHQDVEVPAVLAASPAEDAAHTAATANNTAAKTAAAARTAPGGPEPPVYPAPAAGASG